MSRGKIVRMNDWDALPRSNRLCGSGVLLFCNLDSPKLSIHHKGEMYYFSCFRKSRQGTPFDEIKTNPIYARVLAKSAADVLRGLFFIKTGDRDTAIITTPRRRHFTGYHLATEVCCIISETLQIPFYDNAVQCINRSRLQPQFHLLREIGEKRVIVYDDIITTGMTLQTVNELLREKHDIINIIGINNN